MNARVFVLLGILTSATMGAEAPKKPAETPQRKVEVRELTIYPAPLPRQSNVTQR